MKKISSAINDKFNSILLIIIIQVITSISSVCSVLIEAMVSKNGKKKKNFTSLARCSLRLMCVNVSFSFCVCVCVFFFPLESTLFIF